MQSRIRSIEPNKVYHLTHRGNAKQRVFSHNVGRKQYLNYLAAAAQDYSCNIHGWVLMDNHVHLLCSTELLRGISQMIRKAHGSYARYLNRSRHTEGKVWGGRFFSSSEVDEYSFLSCLAYMDLNPVRAGLCKMPEDWPWSSHQNLGYGISDGITKQHSVYKALGASRRRRQKIYRGLVEGARKYKLAFPELGSGVEY